MDKCRFISVGLVILHAKLNNTFESQQVLTHDIFNG